MIILVIIFVVLLVLGVFSVTLGIITDTEFFVVAGALLLIIAVMGWFVAAIISKALGA